MDEAIWSWYVPMEHSWHVSCAKTDTNPAGHSKQLLPLANLPEAQLPQFSSVGSDKQSEHSSAPATVLKKPAGHDSHGPSDDSPLKSPGSQSEHASSPENRYWPAGQSKQVVLSTFTSFPGAQLAHMPDSTTVVPGGHCSHAVSPVAAVVSNGGHMTHDV